MSFFNKLKNGVVDTGNKAKVVVEVNRLKMQNSSKNKEIEQQQLEIGKITYGILTGKSTSNETQYEPFLHRIAELQADIDANVEQISLLSDSKTCVCGETLGQQVRFCSNCGHQFAEPEEKVVTAEVVEPKPVVIVEPVVILEPVEVVETVSSVESEEIEDIAKKEV